ncbi:hypothetical protein PZ938_13430 [Luteipulveratus sp. YIM 133132]|uniref:hypothetical protein n=1 Tax=Luteipulveratus flavus TaxID=3031728 RepID=UPI0023B17DB0|nr:hypothetical protein [Luteipulveratus sp. YIM 133132]MDE9366609.1 hypothetical protein [Luteipulveratus sp. YIM 133132]
MSAARRAGLVAAAVAVVLVAGCSGGPTPTPSATSPQVVAGWRRLPDPAPGARVRAAVEIGGRTLVVGSVPSGDGRTPAAWTTTNGQQWQRISTRPVTPYGSLADLVMVARDGDRVAAFGQAYGGAHSNPRPTTWTLDLTEATPAFVEHEQSFTLLGGEDAIGVTALSARPAGGFLLTGDWTARTGRYGAAVWTAQDGVTWTRRADAAGLASAPGEQTTARGATAGPGGFVVVGSALGSGVPPSQPLTWTSPDGVSWRRHALPVPESLKQDGAVASAASCDAVGCLVAGSSQGSAQRPIRWTVDQGGHPTRPAAVGPPAGLTQATAIQRVGPSAYVLETVDHVLRLEEIPGTGATARSVLLPVRSRQGALGVVAGRLLLAATDGLWLRDGSVSGRATGGASG